ncbi:MAG: hypothetical protein AMXMBFR83_24190 [Phycisphaerae bacterium]
MSTFPLQQGSIVRASVPDANGFIKSRPLLIISPTDEIVQNRPVAALAITTTFPDPPRADEVPIPWSRVGYPSTGLRKRSAVVCSWRVNIEPSQVEAVHGYLPTVYMTKVMETASRCAQTRGDVEPHDRR